MTWANSTDGIDRTLVAGYVGFNVGTVYDFSAGSIVTVDIDATNDGFTTDGETFVVDGVTSGFASSGNYARITPLTNVDLSPSPDGVVEGTGGDDLIDASYLGDPKCQFTTQSYPLLTLINSAPGDSS